MSYNPNKMTKIQYLLLLSIVALIEIISLFPCQAQSTSNCSNYTFTTTNTTFKACVDLPVLNSSLYWNYFPSTATLQIAYRHPGMGPTSSKWVVWALNPAGTGMVGSQCLVAFHNPDDGSMVVYTSPIASYGTELEKGTLSFSVSGLSAVNVKDEVVLFATIVVPENATEVNQVWQEGPVLGGTPQMHSTSGANVLSMATLNLLLGAPSAATPPSTLGGAGASSSTTAALGPPATTKSASRVLMLRDVHGLLNGVSWGIMMPMGAIIARYMRVFPSADPAWFYLHVGCQLSAYAIGLSGFVTGLQLGGVGHTTHRNIGITLAFLGSLQMFALMIRPKKEHKYRMYWNIYHHSVGYSVIILSSVNIFQGLGILNPGSTWKLAYIGAIMALALLAITLEAFTWYVVLSRNKSDYFEGRSTKPGRPINGGAAYYARPSFNMSNGL